MRRLLLASVLLLGCRRSAELEAKDREIAALKQQLKYLQQQVKVRRWGEVPPGQMPQPRDPEPPASSAPVPAEVKARQRVEGEEKLLKEKLLSLTTQFRQAKTPEEREALRRQMLEARKLTDERERAITDPKPAPPKR